MDNGYIYEIEGLKSNLDHLTRLYKSGDKERDKVINGYRNQIAKINAHIESKIKDEECAIQARLQSSKNQDGSWSAEYPRSSSLPASGGESLTESSTLSDSLPA